MNGKSANGRTNDLLSPSGGKKGARSQRASPKIKLRRAERSESNRRELIRAAVQIIGEFGYAGASISRITERAGLSQGTFYIYFESQQAIFDTVLPELTRDLLNHISEQVHGAADFFEIEERGIRAFFDVVQRNPGLFRIINEAQVTSPSAFAQHLHELTKRYVSSLERARENGDIADGIEPSDYHQIAHMLIGARNYLYLSVVADSPASKDFESAIPVYLGFVRAALGRKVRKSTSQTPKAKPAIRVAKPAGS